VNYKRASFAFHQTMSDDDLPRRERGSKAARTGSGRRAGGQAAARIAAMADLGAKRAMSKSERRAAQEASADEGSAEEFPDDGTLCGASVRGGGEPADEARLASGGRRKIRRVKGGKRRQRNEEEETDAEEEETVEEPRPSAIKPSAGAGGGGRGASSGGGSGGGGGGGLGGLLFSTLESIWLPRARLEAWVHEPFFERLATGCLVRIGLEGTAGAEFFYRAALVRGICDEGAAYQVRLYPYSYLWYLQQRFHR